MALQRRVRAGQPRPVAGGNRRPALDRRSGHRPLRPGCRRHLDHPRLQPGDLPGRHAGDPEELYEAASIDGAGPLVQFRRITLPLLSPSVFFVSVLSVIGSLQLFDLVYVIGGSGQSARNNPAYPRIQTVVALFYEKAFSSNDRGYAAAIVMALLLLIVALTAVQFRLQRRWVHYG
ncbi:carbohydrate ABC transporter permease [Plantactinospora veratri]